MKKLILVLLFSSTVLIQAMVKELPEPSTLSDQSMLIKLPDPSILCDQSMLIKLPKASILRDRLESKGFGGLVNITHIDYLLGGIELSLHRVAEVTAECLFSYRVQVSNPTITNMIDRNRNALFDCILQDSSTAIEELKKLGLYITAGQSNNSRAGFFMYPPFEVNEFIEVGEITKNVRITQYKNIFGRVQREIDKHTRIRMPTAKVLRKNLKIDGLDQYKGVDHLVICLSGRQGTIDDILAAPIADCVYSNMDGTNSFKALFLALHKSLLKQHPLMIALIDKGHFNFNHLVIK